MVTFSPLYFCVSLGVCVISTRLVPAQGTVLYRFKNCAGKGHCIHSKLSRDAQRGEEVEQASEQAQSCL